jgi:hypothetical protein
LKHLFNRPEGRFFFQDQKIAAFGSSYINPDVGAAAACDLLILSVSDMSYTINRFA